MSNWPKLENILHKAALGTATVVSNINVNMDQANTGAQRNHLLDTCRAYSLHNLVTESTRVSPRCPAGTVLDLILTSPAVVTTAFVVPQAFIGHFAVEACLQIDVEHHPPPPPPPPPPALRVQRLRRQLQRIDVNLLRNDLDRSGLHEFKDFSDADAMWCRWYSIVVGAHDPHVPLIESRMKRKNGFPPWSHADLYQLVKRKKKLQGCWIKDRNNKALHYQFIIARTKASNAYRRKRNDIFFIHCQATPTMLGKRGSY